MTTMRIEHVNVTVSDADRSAELMGRIFGWRVRWSGPARDGGRAVHVGSDEHYIALYTALGQPEPASDFIKGQPLNHIALEVGDLDAIEAKVAQAGLKPFAHGDYEPGRRFYFLDRDEIEFEVVSYQAPGAARRTD